MATKRKYRKDTIAYLGVSEYSSVVPEIEYTGLMDGKYYR